MNNDKKIRVMFVCAGNICRSPMVEAVFRNLVDKAGLSDRFEIASSGTGSWHVGERPHPGTQAVLQRYHIPLGDKRARHLSRDDLDYFDYIIVADEENLHDVRAMHTTVRGELRRLLEFAPASTTLNVPDPYYSGNFDRVYELVNEGSSGLLNHIREKEKLS
jgi:protein-tyrosine phosphatase